MEIRLQKFLADVGIASRRKSEELIQQGKVKVNGNIITELGTKINPEVDIVEYESKILNKNENDKKIYILLNKLAFKFRVFPNQSSDARFIICN